MFCNKCGNEIKEGMKFCSKCGAEVQAVNYSIPQSNTDKTELINPAMSGVDISGDNNISQADNSKAVKQPKPKKEKNKMGGKIAILAILIVVVLALAGALAYFLFGDGFSLGNAKERQFNEYMSDAENNYEEGNYGDAIDGYKAALEIDPKSEEAYEELAKTYYKKGDLNKAIKTLETGVEVTESDHLQKQLDKYEAELEDGGEGDGSGETSEGESDTSGGEEATSTEGGTETGDPSEAATTTTEAVPEPFKGVKTDIDISVKQVDNSAFPSVTLYTSITDKNGAVIENMQKSDFDVQEIDVNGNIVDVTIDDVYQVLHEDNISIELVMDASGSMDGSKMSQAKNAAIALVDYMSLTDGDQVEVISFENYVYLEQEFTSNSDMLKNAINNINTGDMTALYDGIYAGLYQTNLQRGAKSVIAFTDGKENYSSYSFDDVVAMAQNTGIPVYIIGIGGYYDIDEASLRSLAEQCSGKYYSADSSDFQSILQDIYIDIYKEQQNYYVVKYTTTNTANPDQFRNVVLQTSAASQFSGYYKKPYVPITDISGAFSSRYSNVDFIFDFSSDREISDSELRGLSLAELRIARNEIFARHGRQFVDPLLNQWFYSKTWYLNIPNKYSPTDFDTYHPNPLSKLEIGNVDKIKKYEEAKMATEDIFPNASVELLSDYDLALSKPVLKTALAQMRNYPASDILTQNIKLVQDESEKEDVQY